MTADPIPLKYGLAAHYVTRAEARNKARRPDAEQLELEETPSD